MIAELTLLEWHRGLIITMIGVVLWIGYLHFQINNLKKSSNIKESEE